MLTYASVARRSLAGRRRLSLTKAAAKTHEACWAVHL